MQATYIVKGGIRPAYSDYSDHWRPLGSFSTLDEAKEVALKWMSTECRFGRSFPAKVICNGQEIDLFSRKTV